MIAPNCVRWCLATGVVVLLTSAFASASYDGKASKGDKSCTAKFKYDTENGLDGTVISQDCAHSLGLGTKKADGTFEAPAGTPEISTANRMCDCKSASHRGPCSPPVHVGVFP